MYVHPLIGFHTPSKDSLTGSTYTEESSAAVDPPPQRRPLLGFPAPLVTSSCPSATNPPPVVPRLPLLPKPLLFRNFGHPPKPARPPPFDPAPNTSLPQSNSRSSAPFGDPGGLLHIVRLLFLHSFSCSDQILHLFHLHVPSMGQGAV